MRQNVEQMLRAATALQVAAFEFGADETQTQYEARQAIIGMREALNSAQQCLASMQRACELRRHGK